MVAEAEAEAAVAAASAAALARATSSRLEVAAEEPTGAEGEATGKADGTEPSAAAVEVALPIGGAVSRVVASMTGELGVLDAMELGDKVEELKLGRI